MSGRPEYKALIANANVQAGELLGPLGATKTAETEDVGLLAELARRVGEAAMIMEQLRQHHSTDTITGVAVSIRKDTELQIAMGGVVGASQPDDLDGTSLATAIGYADEVKTGIGEGMVNRHAAISEFLDKGLEHLAALSTGVVDPLRELIPGAPNATGNVMTNTEGVQAGLKAYYDVV